MGALALVLNHMGAAAGAVPAAGQPAWKMGTAGAAGGLPPLAGVDAHAAPGAEGEGGGLLRQSCSFTSEVLGRCLLALMQVCLCLHVCVCVCVCVCIFCAEWACRCMRQQVQKNLRQLQYLRSILLW